LNTKTEQYLLQIFGKHYSKYEKMINKALEKNFAVQKNSDFNAIKAAFEAIYDKYMVRVLEDDQFYCKKYGLKKGTYRRYYLTVERLLQDYLFQVDQLINQYVDLFQCGMNMIASMSDLEYLRIEDFLNATFRYVEQFGKINRDEAKTVFCSYFYLLGFEAKKGRTSSNQYKLYITPEKSNLYLNIKVRRGIFSE